MPTTEPAGHILLLWCSYIPAVLMSSLLFYPKNGVLSTCIIPHFSGGGGGWGHVPTTEPTWYSSGAHTYQLY